MQELVVVMFDGVLYGVYSLEKLGELYDLLKIKRPEYYVDFYSLTKDGKPYAHVGTTAQYVDFNSKENFVEMMLINFHGIPTHSTPL